VAAEAVALADTTDFLYLRWHVRMSQAEVLRLNGQPEDAIAVLEEAVRLADEKGCSVAAEQARAMLGRSSVTSGR
jgi:hypothetical protein